MTTPTDAMMEAIKTDLIEPAMEAARAAYLASLELRGDKDTSGKVYVQLSNIDAHRRLIAVLKEAGIGHPKTYPVSWHIPVESLMPPGFKMKASMCNHEYACRAFMRMLEDWEMTPVLVSHIN